MGWKVVVSRVDKNPGPSYGVAVCALLVGLLVGCRQDTVDPYVILEQHYKATGYGDSLRPIETSFVLWSVLDTTGSVVGKGRVWTKGDSLWRMEAIFKYRADIVGDNGSVFWATREFGRVDTVRDPLLLGERTRDIAHSQGRHMERDSDEFTLKYLGLGEVEGHPCYLIRESTTLVSSTIVYYIDTLNYYLRRTDEVYDSGEIDSTVRSGFRQVDGVVRAFFARGSAGPFTPYTILREDVFIPNATIVDRIFDPTNQVVTDEQYGGEIFIRDE